MRSQPPERVRAGARRQTLILAAVALPVLFAGISVVGSMPSPGQRAAASFSGSSVPPRPTAAATRRPIAVSPQAPPTAREIELFGQQLQLTIPDGTYADSRNQATIVGQSMRVTIERWPVGASHVVVNGAAGTVTGSTLDEIAASVEPLLPSNGVTYARAARSLDDHAAVIWGSSRGLPTDGRPFSITVVIDASTVYLVQAFATQPGNDGLTLARFASLHTTIDFLTPFDVVGLGGRVALTLPGTLHVGLSTSRDLRIDFNGGSLLSSIGPLSLHRATVGAPSVIMLPTTSGTSEATIEGRDLSEVAASLEETSGNLLRKRNRRWISVDGYPGAQWTYAVEHPWGAILGALHVTVRVVVVGRNAYLLTGDDSVIHSIRFLR